VSAKAGATLPRRDAIDTRVIDMVRTARVSTGNGIINDPREVGGYPDYSFSPDDVPLDGDHDGVPDEWEKKYDLNPGAATDGSIDSDQDGYTNVEEYLNGANPREKINCRNLGHNIDTIS
jgi:pectate lyase